MNFEEYPASLGTVIPFSGYVTMALLAKDNTQAYAIGACKEYVLDCTLNTVHKGHSNGIYSAYKEISLDEVRLAVCGLDNKVLNSLNLINMFEDVLEMPPTKVNKVSAGVLFRGHNRWMVAPPMLSLYAMLARVGRSHEIGPNLSESLEKFYNVKTPDMNSPSYYTTYTNNANLYQDSTYMIGSRKGMERILTYGDRKIFGEDMKANWKVGTDIHNRGIQTYSSGGLKSVYPNWYKHMGKT